MKKLNEETANSEELYDYCVKEYVSTNFISQTLIRGFFSVIKNILLPIKPSLSKILEIGCGAGESSLRIQEMMKGIQYDATEYDPRYIEAIRKRNIQINISKEDVYDIKRPNSSYECIIMLEVLEHLQNVDLALAEIFRVSSR